MMYFPKLLSNLEFYIEMYLEFKIFLKFNLLQKVIFEYKSSYFIEIPTGNKKKNRKWVNGEETLHPFSTASHPSLLWLFWL